MTSNPIFNLLLKFIIYMFDLKDKNILITGASGGIGKAIASACIAQGAWVAFSGTNEAKLQATAKELGAPNAICLACDLSDKASVQALGKQAEKALGQVDILVNNAGITRDGLAMRMSDDDWQDVLNVNLTASFILIRTLLRGMMKRKQGRIINIGSVVGTSGNAGQANYAAAKAGMVGMTKSLAAEVASRGITVNAIAPGFIQTAMTDALNETQRDNILASIPAGTLGTPEDIAAATVFLASDEARYITGQTLHANGGMLMV